MAGNVASLSVKAGMVRGALSFAIGGFIGLIVLIGVDSALMAWLGRDSLHGDIASVSAMAIAGALGGAGLRCGWRATAAFGVGFAVGFIPVTPNVLLPIGLQAMTGREGFSALWPYFVSVSSPWKFAVAGAISLASLRGFGWPRTAAVGGAVFGGGTLIGASIGASIASLHLSSLPSLLLAALVPFFTPLVLGGAYVGRRLSLGAEPGDHDADRELGVVGRGNQ